MIGEVGRGMRVALGSLERSRLGAAAQAVGIAQGATDYAVGYANERVAFGEPIMALQAIQFKLADMQTGTAAARELLYKASALADRDPAPADLGMWTSMAKLFASDNAMRVTVEAVQVLGGYGYVNDHPVERMMRDAKITQIYEGTNEIQRVVIARHLAGTLRTPAFRCSAPRRPGARRRSRPRWRGRARVEQRLHQVRVASRAASRSRARLASHGRRRRAAPHRARRSIWRRSSARVDAQGRDLLRPRRAR